ncbi:hypothetical protein SASPL_108707 [Salvia splendens]|uniref:Uncharacterized protein n=1 Tax=Salvia splendens TaxID=180675 RepID=A0A8X8YCS1_SALSN|nr:hypothetical protein SASPL_108707 [Salvia splendens]
MEGLIPLVYKAIVQFRNGGGQSGLTWPWLDDTQSAVAYMRLPGDSGRFNASDIQIFRQDYGFSSASSERRAVSTAGNHYLIKS